MCNILSVRYINPYLKSWFRCVYTPYCVCLCWLSSHGRDQSLIVWGAVREQPAMPWGAGTGRLIGLLLEKSLSRVWPQTLLLSGRGFGAVFVCESCVCVSEWGVAIGLCLSVLRERERLQYQAFLGEGCAVTALVCKTGVSAEAGREWRGTEERGRNEREGKGTGRCEEEPSNLLSHSRSPFSHPSLLSISELPFPHH